MMATESVSQQQFLASTPNVGSNTSLAIETNGSEDVKKRCGSSNRSRTHTPCPDELLRYSSANKFSLDTTQGTIDEELIETNESENVKKGSGSSNRSRTHTPCPDELLRYASANKFSLDTTQDTIDEELTVSSEAVADPEDMGQGHLQPEGEPGLDSRKRQADSKTDNYPKHRKRTPLYAKSSEDGEGKAPIQIKVQSTGSEGMLDSTESLSTDTRSKSKLKPKPKHATQEEIKLRSPRNRHLPRHHEQAATGSSVPVKPTATAAATATVPKRERQNSVAKFLSSLLSWRGSSSSKQVSPTTSTEENSYNSCNSRSGHPRHEDPPSYRVSLRQYETVAEDKVVEFSSAFPPELEEGDAGDAPTQAPVQAPLASQ